MHFWGDTASRCAFCKTWGFLWGRGRREQSYLSLCASISSRCSADHSGHPAAHRGTLCPLSYHLQAVSCCSQTDEGHSCSPIADTATCCLLSPHLQLGRTACTHRAQSQGGRAAEAHHCPLRHLCREGWAHSTGTASGAAAAQQSLHELSALGPAVTGSMMLGHCNNLLSGSAELQLPQHSPSYVLGGGKQKLQRNRCGL